MNHVSQLDTLARIYLTTANAEKANQALVVLRLDGMKSLMFGLPAVKLQKLQKIPSYTAENLTRVHQSTII